MNVLVVEDNKAVSLIICRIIEELGHEYVLAADGEAALYAAALGRSTGRAKNLAGA